VRRSPRLSGRPLEAPLEEKKKMQKVKRTTSNLSVNGLRGSDNVSIDGEELKDNLLGQSSKRSEKSIDALNTSGIREPEDSSSESDNESGKDENEDRDHSSSSQPTETVPGSNFSPRKSSVPNTPIGSASHNRTLSLVLSDEEIFQDLPVRKLVYSSDEPGVESAQINEPRSPASAEESAEDQTIETVTKVTTIITTTKVNPDSIYNHGLKSKSDMYRRRL